MVYVRKSLVPRCGFQLSEDSSDQCGMPAVAEWKVRQRRVLFVCTVHDDWLKNHLDYEEEES